MPETLPLAGLTVVVTRPRKQVEATAAALRAAGAKVIEFPVLEITPRACTLEAATLAGVRIAIFVSANAVEHGLPCLQRGGGLAPGTIIAAIGRATTRALNGAGLNDVVSPQHSIDSEGLLAMPQLQPERVCGQHIVLVRGRSIGGGRTLLEETLVARGAKVTVAECYERIELRPSSAEVDALVESMKSNPAIMALSVETLDSLMKSLAGRELNLETAWLLVPHPRVAAAARARHFTRVIEVGMSAESLVDALSKMKPDIDAVAR